jgi:hypothetical protein
MRKRITLLIAALTMALTMSFGGVAFAKQAQEGPQGTGCTTTHQGNSTSSPVVSSNRGGPNSQSSVSC